MRPITIKIDIPQQGSNAYYVRIGSETLSGCGGWARKRLGSATRAIAVVSNTTVFPLYGDAVCDSLRDAGFTVVTFQMPDGERHKSLRSLDSCLTKLSAGGVGRSDAVLALGGGVVGDLAGFAASVHLRGIPFLQVPTTLLAMVDSSVGGKTGVNSTAGKNLIGSFHQPSGVLIDPKVLETLPEREMTSGFCEMVKHAALAGPELLAETSGYLSQPSEKRLASLIARNIDFKCSIVEGDPFESTELSGNRSRKILNLGHTLAHALEKVTNYRRLRHGEAVGYGLLFAAELSKSLDFLDEKSVNSLYDVVHRVGTLPSLRKIDPRAVLEAFSFDKKRIGDSLQFILLKGIGKPVVINSSDIPPGMIETALKAVLR